MVGLLGRAVDIHNWLLEDRSSPRRARVERDRAIGKEISHADTTTRVLQRADRVGVEAGSGGRLESLRRTAVPVVTAIGLLAGSGIASVALAYEGDYPVNLLSLLGVLVVIPGVLLVLTVLACLMRAVGWTPLARALSAVNLNRLVVGWWTRLGGDIGEGRATQALLHWQIVAFSQWMSLGFFVGVLGTLLALVAFTDLAFGWSTTLELDSGRVYAWASTIAAPWAGWLDDATPTQALVEVSRFSRLEGSRSATEAATLGAWWPFVMMTIVTWGVLPRLLVLGVAVWRLRNSERSVLIAHPDVAALLDRLASPEAEFRAPLTFDTGQQASPGAVGELMLSDDALQIVWNGALAVSERAVALDNRQQSSEMRAALIAAANANSDRVAIYVKSWDPPLLEFADVVALVREAFATARISIVPVGIGGGAPAEPDLAIWAAAIDAMDDPAVRVQPLGEPA